MANGFNGTLSLSAAFNNVSAVWLVYKGYYQTPTDGKSFEVKVDNLVLGNAVTTPSPTAVPIPALGLWGLGSLVAGLGLGLKRQRHI